MDEVYEILIRKNIRNVATINENIEDLDSGNPQIQDVINGISELNRYGIVVLHIETGQSKEGITKIKNINDFGLYKDGIMIKDPTIYNDLPEDKIVPFKSDSWILGEFIVKQKTGKNIPKRFLKSQNLLNTFINDDEILQKLLVIDHSKRSYVWDIYEQPKDGGCSVQ
jgi:hypothetical protein